MYTRKLLKKAVAIAKLKMFIVPAEIKLNPSIDAVLYAKDALTELQASYRKDFYHIVES